MFASLSSLLRKLPSVCYRGYAKDEVQAMLEHAPKAGFKVVDVHGPLTWSPPAIDALDAHALRKMFDFLIRRKIKTKIEDAGLKCAGIYTPGFGGANQEQIEIHARAIAKATSLCAILGGEHLVSTGTVTRQGHDISGVISCVQRIVELLPPDNKIKIGLEPHYGEADTLTLVDLRSPRFYLGFLRKTSYDSQLRKLGYDFGRFA